jgi:hypothetical protein
MEEQPKMADSSRSPQFPMETSNAPEQQVRVVSNWGLDVYKDEIIALHSRPGIQIKDLPQLVEQELGIKAKCALSSQFSISGYLIFISGRRHTGSLEQDGQKRKMFPQGIVCAW